MARNPITRSFMSTDELKALREILEKVRQAIGTHARSIMAPVANVKATDLDNFMGVRVEIQSQGYPPTRAGGFRSQYPSNAFQKRMLNYVFSDDPHVKYVTKLEVGSSWESLKSKFHEASEIPDEDNLFRHLRSIGAVNDESCERVGNTLSGNYEVYRLSSERTGFGRLHVSHLVIDKYDVYNKVPSFTNRISLGGGKERDVTGSVIELGNSYFFFGYVRKDGDPLRKIGSYRGSKVMVLKEIKRLSPTTLMGFFYTSGSDEVYDIGATRVIKYKGKFNPNRHRIYPLDMTNARALKEGVDDIGIGFKIEDIALEFVGQDRRESLVFSSLDFDMISPQRRRRGVTKGG